MSETRPPYGTEQQQPEPLLSLTESACSSPDHGTSPCGRCPGCCGGEEWCCDFIQSEKERHRETEARLAAVTAALEVSLAHWNRWWRVCSSIASRHLVHDQTSEGLAYRRCLEAYRVGVGKAEQKAKDSG